jgi:diguanylate cyclase (GGDEF)-like protein
MKSSTKLEFYIVCSLLLLTSIIYLLQYYSLNQNITFDAHSKVALRSISDAGSKSSLAIINDEIILDCEIIASDYAWPFCEITFQLYDDHQMIHGGGMNFSSYESVSIFAKYHNIAPTGIRFQLRSYNKIYSKENEDSTLKYNGLEYSIPKDFSVITIPMNALQVSTWWLAEKKIPIQYSAPEFDDTMVIELSTGNNIKPGKYQIVLEKIVFHGKLFTNDTVYMLIIILWVSATLFLFFYHLAQSRRKLKLAQKKSMELKRLNQLLNTQSLKLKDQAGRDELTGALNRTGLKAIFIEQLPILSIAFIDIDHFKKVNDNYGHAVGDEILKQFVVLLSESSRDTDFLARWGGEEFLLVCPNTTLSQMQVLAESIRKMIEMHLWSNGIELTSSFGVAQKGKESTTAFIHRADKALYAAKAQGRNRVKTSQTSNKKK